VAQTGTTRTEAGLRAMTKRKFRELAGKCARCGWNLEVLVLHVHHIDHDHRNENPSNWEVLCPTCHKHHHFLDKRQSNYRITA
jgi:5-methylcytosine-specific restriction endonuclease McrA